MKLREKDYWLGFNLCPGIGLKRFYHLLKLFGSAKKSWHASEKKLLETNIPHKILDNFIVFREEMDLNTVKVGLEKSLINYIIIEENTYPVNLKKITNPPPLLYIKGSFKKADKQALAVVGARKITPYGREVTEKITSVLVNKGFTIVSGLARGVDSMAHRVALGNNGRTIAVLGCGLDRIYPPEHKVLAEKIVLNEQGVLISQYPPGTEPLRGHFPQRNRIIAGLSLGVLVTEGEIKSGTKITTDFAHMMKKPVFAVPGPITSSMSEGPAELIKNGARLVTKAEDIISHVADCQGLKYQVGNNIDREVKNIKYRNNKEERICTYLQEGRKHIDDIIRMVSLPSSDILSCLTELELKGMVKNIGSGFYILS